MSQVTQMPPRDREAAPQMGPLFIGVAIPISVLLWFGVLFQAAFVVPWFQKIYLDFAMQVPIVTEQVIHSIWWATPVLMLASFVPCAVLRSRWMWIVLLIVFPIFVNLAVFINLYLPYLKLLEALGGQLPNG